MTKGELIANGYDTNDDIVCMYCGWPDCRCYDDDEDEPCSWCCGDGWQENDDPLWYGFDTDWIECECCGGTGLAKHQTIF